MNTTVISLLLITKPLYKQLALHVSLKETPLQVFQHLIDDSEQ